MKLTVLAVLLGLTGAAAADEYRPEPAPRAERQQLRRMVLERFDRNNDGRLEPAKRRQAVRALRRMARQLDREDRRQAKMQKLMRRYDTNHDGNLDPGEVPRTWRNKLRRFDRNGDGWVDPGELPR